MQVETLLKSEDRAVLPLGSVEQHAYLSLATDCILAERVAVDAAEPLKVPVFPVVPYGITPFFMAYPGTVSLRMSTYLELVRDALDSLVTHGFRRILIVNGHGGNAPAQTLVAEWTAAREGVRVKFHNWWNAPKVMAQVRAFDPVASHASWMENFEWTRLAGVAMPGAQKPMVDWARVSQLGPSATRAALGDGNFGGRYQRADAEMAEIWRTAVAETRELLEAGWA
jgi:creatinine amidohydrolase